MLETQGENSKTLHIYLLCILPRVRTHACAVALVPNRLRDVQATDDIRYDLTIMESTLVILMGSVMSEEGQAAFQPTIRWMAHSAEWAHRVRCSNAGLPCPVG